MGKSHNDRFTNLQNRTAELAKAMGHPARVAILEHLIKTQGCVCGDLVDVLPLSQSTISQHLKALKEVGIIQGNVEGTSVCYCINPTVWSETMTFFNSFFEKGKCCC